MMMRYILPLLLLITGVAKAQDLPGDPIAGLDFARGHRAACHYVEKDWVDLYVNEAPDVFEIAVQPANTGMALRVILQTPHRRLPNFILEPTERDDVISYILSLRAEFKDQVQ